MEVDVMFQIILDNSRNNKNHNSSSSLINFTADRRTLSLECARIRIQPRRSTGQKDDITNNEYRTHNISGGF